MSFFITAFLKDIKIYMECFSKLLKYLAIFVNKFLYGNAGFLGSLDIFQCIFVTTGKKARFVTQESVVARNDISLNKFQCVTDMWFCIDIRNSCCDIKLCHSAEI